MAQPMTLKQLIAAYDKWGVPYKIIGDPATHRRDPGHGAWGPLHGTMIHHTGDDAPDTNDSRVISQGRAGLPGPLAQNGVRDDGVVEIHSIGRSNHAGGGDPRVLDAVIAESYGKYPPKTAKHEGEAGSVDGNPHFVGFECYYSGSHKMTDLQYRSLVLANAAILDFYKWSEKSAIGHKEWSDWKIDPGPYDMAVIRADIATALRVGPQKIPVNVKKPAPHPTPNITRALAENIRYRKRLEAINNPPIDKAVNQLIGEVKQQYSFLQDQERK